MTVDDETVAAVVVVAAASQHQATVDACGREKDEAPEVKNPATEVAVESHRQDGEDHYQGLSAPRDVLE